jgi:hypothetical protein
VDYIIENPSVQGFRLRAKRFGGRAVALAKARTVCFWFTDVEA